MSALPPKADMDQHGRDVRFVPTADISSSIRSPCQRRSIGQVGRAEAHPWLMTSSNFSAPLGGSTLYLYSHPGRVIWKRELKDRSM